MSKFKKGQSGNPKGRPPGSGISPQLRQIIEDNAIEILQALILQAKNGDTQASKILLDKVIPSIKSQAMSISIPVGETLSETGNNIVTETMTGNVPPDIGGSLITALSNQAKLVEYTELSLRLERIEQQLGKRQ